MSQLKNTNPILTIYLFLLITHFSICNASSSSSSSSVLDFITEPEMESETSRRLLAMQKKYISYETLNRDLVPCARPGASYYNCHAVAANPYTRGCEVITRCRGTSP